MNEENKAAFTPADMKALWYLALGLGVTLCGECVIAKNSETIVLAIFLNVATMVICPLVIYLLRRAK